MRKPNCLFPITLILSIMLIGCTSQPYKASGTISTKNNEEFIIEGNGKRFILKPSRAKIEISRDPLISGKFSLFNWGGEVSAVTHRKNYDSSGVTIDSVDSGLNYDVRIEWHQYESGTNFGVVTVSCFASGVCAGTENYLDCNGTQYVEGSEEYRKHKDSNECKSYSRSTNVQRSDCPGKQKAEKGFLKSATRIHAIFFNRKSKESIIAEFDGFTEETAKNVWTKNIGNCKLNGQE